MDILHIKMQNKNTVYFKYFLFQYKLLRYDIAHLGHLPEISAFLLFMIFYYVSELALSIYLL